VMQQRAQCDCFVRSVIVHAVQASIIYCSCGCGSQLAL
jgi:hypothetical protein